MTYFITALFLVVLSIILIYSRKRHDELFEMWIWDVEKELDRPLTTKEYILLMDTYNENHLLTTQKAIELILRNEKSN